LAVFLYTGTSVLLKMYNRGLWWWLMPVFRATQELEIGRIKV
jgi:hypothetical protein